MTRVHLPELVVDGKRLGRQIDHDPRSLHYLLPETETAVSVTWPRHVAILDQGNVGSCTGNAIVGALGTGPLYDALQHSRRTYVLDEALAVSIYSAAEKLDGGAGYPPEDEGSSGLSVAKAATTDGWISGYQHATSVAAAHTALRAGPFIIGTYWYADMDQPARNGLVSATGTIRGGHEYLCREYDAGGNLWWFDNSWSTEWGAAGRFCYSSQTLERLLAGQGDITSLVPINQQPPTPNPGPDVVTRTFTVDAADRLDTWSLARHTGSNKQAAADWRSSRPPTSSTVAHARRLHHRSAETGQYVDSDYAARNESTTYASEE